MNSEVYKVSTHPLLQPPSSSPTCSPSGTNSQDILTTPQPYFWLFCCPPIHTHTATWLWTLDPCHPCQHSHWLFSQLAHLFQLTPTPSKNPCWLPAGSLYSTLVFLVSWHIANVHCLSAYLMHLKHHSIIFTTKSLAQGLEHSNSSAA